MAMQSVTICNNSKMIIKLRASEKIISAPNDTSENVGTTIVKVEEKSSF